MFSLKKFLEGAIAQANPFDHGKTAATVLRPNRPAPPPAQTRPQVQQRQPGGMPSYGSGFSGVVNRYRDVLDANTPQDVYRRNQEKMKQWRAPMEAPKLNQTYREQQIELGNKRPYQNVGATLAGSTARLLNTGEQARQEIFDTARLYGAQARNDVEDLASTNRRIRERQQREYQPDSGLLGQGTIFDKPSDFNTMGAKELTKRVVSTTAGAGLEIAPLSKGAGVTEKILSIAPNAFTRGAIRAGAGALEGGTQDVLEQQVNRDNFSPVQAATSAVFGGVLANAGPAASAVVGKAKQPTTKLIQPKPVDVAPAPTTRLAPPKPVTPVAPTTRLVQTNTPPVQAPVVRAIDPLESLKQEARKYKSAEEFDNVLQRGVTKPEFAPKPQQYNQLAPKPSKQHPLEALKAEARQATGARSDYSPENLQANRQIRAKNASSITYADKKAIKPDELVTVYRAVPGKAKGGLTEGDWVTPNKEQARLFMKQSWAQDDTGAKIVTKKVKASELRYHADDAKGYVDDELLYVPKSDPLEALKQEARKYKSAEEFVRAQGEPVYHGTTEKIQGDFKYPLYTTPKRDYAQVFADSASASSIAKSGVKAKDAAMVHEFAVNPKARVMDIHDPTVRDLLNKEYFGKYSMSDKFYPGQNGHLDWTEGQNLAEFIHDKKLPYDAIKLDEGGGGVDPQFGSKVIDKGVSYLALNKNALRSKQQLTDLYNQATQSQPPKSPLKTADVEAELDKFYGRGGDQEFMSSVIKKYESKLNGKNTVLDLMDAKEKARYAEITGESQPPLNVEGKDPYIKEYADVLRDQESGRSGGELIDTADGKKRITNHTPFYREYFKEHKRAPTREDYYLEAERQVKEGNADPGFMEYYNEVNKSRGSLPDTAKVIEEKAPGKLSEAEWQAKLSQAQKEGVRVTKPTALKRRAEYSERIKEAVQAGDLTEANRLRAESQQFNTEVKLQTKENLPKNAQVLVDETGEVKAPLSLKDRSTKDSFVEATKEYLGKTKSRKIERDARIIDLNKRHTLSNDEKVSAILSIDDSSIRPANQKVSNYVDEFRALTDKAYGDYTSQGIKMGFVQEYLPRLYKHPTTGQAISGNEYRLLTQGSARQRGRSAELLNPDALIYKDPTKILDDYYRSLDNAVTGRKYMDRLERDGIIVKSNGPVRGLRPIIAEGMQAEDGLIYYAPKDVANKLNNLFGGKEAANLVESVAGTAKNINSLVQSFVLSGGIPNTPVNAFGIMQVTKEAMALHPLKAGKAFFGAGFSKKFSKNLFNKKKDILKLMAEHDVAPRVDLQEVSKTGRQRIKERAGKLGTANQMWDEITNDSTFGRFMPALEVMHFENIYKKALKRKTPEEAAQIAAESTKNFYGRTSDYKLATRAKLTDDTMGAVFFAPKFRESMVNFWGKNVKALGHPTKLEYRDNIKFLTAAAVVYAGYEGLNKAMNGVWMHDNPDGKKDKLLIPDKNIPWDTHGKDIGLPFLSSIATVPRNAVQGLFNAGTGRFTEAKKNAESFLSMPLNTLGDITSNEDYFGGKIVDDNSSVLDKFSQAGAYIAKSNMQPWIREGLNVAGKGLSADLRKKLGIKDKSLTETIANATESPLRFYDPKYYRYSDSWTPRGGKNEKFTIAEQRDRAGIKKEIDAIPGRLGLNKRQKADFDALNAVEFTANGELKEDNNPFYKSQRYTKLQDDGVFEAMKQKAELNAKLNGKPIDPIYNMDGEARRVLLWKKTLPPGTTDPTVKLLYEQDWYQDYRDEESAYYAKKQKWNKKMGYKEPAKNTNEYPKASNEVEKAQNYYFDLPKGTGARSAFIRNNPNLWDKMVGYWDAKDSWTNGERGKLGLGKLEEKTTGYSSSSKGGKYAKGGRKSGGRKASTKSKFGFDPYKFAKKSSKLSDELLALIEQTKTKKRPKAKKAKQMT